METNLGMDRIQETPVEGMIARWKRIVERQEYISPFSMFYLAGTDQKQEIAINYLAHQLDIDEDDRVTVYEPKRRDLRVALEEIGDKVRSLKGKRVLIIARGFEEAVNNGGEDILFRYGHDWDQDVVEDANNR